MHIWVLQHMYIRYDIKCCVTVMWVRMRSWQIDSINKIEFFKMKKCSLSSLSFIHLMQDSMSDWSTVFCMWLYSIIETIARHKVIERHPFWIIGERDVFCTNKRGHKSLKSLPPSRENYKEKVQVFQLEKLYKFLIRCDKFLFVEWIKYEKIIILK